VVVAVVFGVVSVVSGPDQPPQAVRDDALLDRIEALAKQLGIRESVVRTFLQEIGEDPNIPPEEHETVLAQLAQRYKEMQARLARLEIDNPDLAPVLDDIRTRIDAGDFDGAERTLNDAIADQQSTRQRMEEDYARVRDRLIQAGLNEALLLAETAEVRRLRLDDLGAAALFAAAVEVLPDAPDRPDVAERRVGYRIDQANALIAHGERRGGAEALTQAIALMDKVLADINRATTPDTWAALQNNLGSALQTLGERAGDPARLEAAVTAYRAALEERTRDRVPQHWATAQHNLGNALGALGALAVDPARLEAAVTAYRLALEERTRDRVPLRWATAQHNLGNALGALGALAVDPARLEAAAEAYRLALEEWTRDRVPLDWATVQHNLGNALQALGVLRQAPTLITQAITAFEGAREVFREAGVSHYTGIVDSNLARARRVLADLTGGDQAATQ